MKKQKRITREFEKIKSQLKQISEIEKGTSDSNLWRHESVIRKKIKALKEFGDSGMRDYDAVFEDYLRLLDRISRRVLDHYNRKNKTGYVFEEVVGKNKRSYISSGILSVLITHHIPALVAEDFRKFFPENPKDEYQTARNRRRKAYLHLGETNTGKTFYALEKLKDARVGVYLAPLRILALEVFETLNNRGVPCSLITGEEEIIVPGASHVSSTVEKLKTETEYDVAVIDEIQMIGNPQRGQAWTRALLSVRSPEIHVCGAQNAKELIIKILEDCGDSYEIKEYRRAARLEIQGEPFELRRTTRGDALVEFSKKRVLSLYQTLSEQGIKPSVIYGDLPPEVRKMQYEAFCGGDTGVLITTDAIGMGVNLPIRRVVFMGIKKFDGDEIRYLTKQEVKQIAGRAGRLGIYDIGYVAARNMIHIEYLTECLETKDVPIKEAVIEPGESILQVKGLPLSEKIALWSDREQALDYYRKMDVRDYLLILESIKAYHLPEEIQFRLMKMPFDVNLPELFQCFLSYVEQAFVRKGRIAAKPTAPAETLFSLETYYQKVNLYYSFCKTFGLDFDEEWVYAERTAVSKRINRLLLRL